MSRKRRRRGRQKSLLEPGPLNRNLRQLGWFAAALIAIVLLFWIFSLFQNPVPANG